MSAPKATGGCPIRGPRHYELDIQRLRQGKGSSSNLNRTHEANSGVPLARDGANTPLPELPEDIAGEAKDSRWLELDVVTYLPLPVSASSVESFEALAVGEAVCSWVELGG